MKLTLKDCIHMALIMVTVVPLAILWLVAVAAWGCIDCVCENVRSLTSNDSIT